MRTPLLIAVVVLCVCSCAAGSMFRATGMKKAVFDLECPAEQIEVTRLDGAGREVGAEGCGRRATYKVINNSWTRQGDVAETR